MKSKLKPADAKARALLEKLQALAERGVDGEKAVAQKKLARLKARFDFSEGGTGDTLDLFAGNFSRSDKAHRIWKFESGELDVANSVKWAIETATRIPCLFRHNELMAEATPATAKRLMEIAAQIAGSFRALVAQFRAVDGVNDKDRGVFVMGLYDGMMNEAREVGQRLPGRAVVKQRKTKKAAAPPDQSVLNIHPYSIGLSLGKQIRFSVPLADISAELESVTRKHLN